MDLVFWRTFDITKEEKEGNGRIHSLVNSYSFEIEKSSRFGRLIDSDQQQ